MSRPTWGDVAEMQEGCRGDLGEMWGRRSAHQLADQPVEVEDDRGVVALHLGRYRRDVGEIWARYRRDVGEIWARCGRDVGEIWARYRRDMGEIGGGTWGIWLGGVRLEPP